MNSKLGYTPFALRTLLLTFIFTIWACSSQPAKTTDDNTTEPDISDTNATAADTNQTTTEPDASDANSTGTDSNQTSSLEADYPLDFCVVSGNDFGEDPNMIPYLHVHNGTPIKFCCKPCLPRFEKDPERYLAFMKEEIEALAK